MRKFGRVWAIEVGATRYEGLDLQFVSTYPGKGQPATCDVAVFMPPRELVDALHDRTTVCRVLAGYKEEGPVEVFLGTPVAKSVRDRLSDVDPAVRFQLSAAKSYVTRASISLSWADVPASEVIDAIRRELGLAADYIELPTDVRYARGHVVEGAPIPALAEVVEDCGAAFSIEGGRLRITPKDGAVPRLVDEWSPESGLLEIVSPDGGEEVTASALLCPAVRPGDTISVRSPRWTGEVKVQAVRHMGQTDGDAWDTEITGVPRAA